MPVSLAIDAIAGCSGATASGWFSREPPMLSNVARASEVPSCGVVVSPAVIAVPAGIALVLVPTRIHDAPSVE
jgi:hypothetical protein